MYCPHAEKIKLKLGNMYFIFGALNRQCVQVCQQPSKTEPVYYQRGCLIVYYVYFSPVIKMINNWDYSWPVLGIRINYIPNHVTLATIGWLKVDSHSFQNAVCDED